MSESQEKEAKPAIRKPHPLFYAYMYLVIVLGFTSLVWALYRIPTMQSGYQWIFLALVAGITGFYCVTIPAANSKISIGDSLFFTNLILFGIPAGVITQVMDSLSASCRSKNRARRLQYVFFNVAATALSAHISGTLFFSMMKRGPLARSPVQSMRELFVPLGILAIVHYIINSGSVSLIVALDKRRNPYSVWKDSFLWSSVTYFIGAAAAGFIAFSVGRIQPEIFIILIIVVLVVYFTYKTYLDKVAELQKLKLNLEEEVKQRTRELQNAIERAMLLADAAEAASRAKSNFLATMSHEIRTPLNAVIGYSEMLQEDADDLGYPQLVPDLQKIGSAGKHLLNLINDILDFSKIEAGMLKLNPIQFSPQKTIEELIEIYSRPAEEKGLALVCSIEEPLPQLVIGDPDRLRQILTNLIGNAIKFTHAGSINVRVRINSIKEPTFLRFEVIDTGVGIPVEAQGLIFHVFSQADGSTTRKYGGTGLGLAIVKQLVEMMDGTVGVVSEPGKGSCFWFTARFQTVQEVVAVPPAHAITEGELSCHAFASGRI